jgi:hypothetical protein
MGPGAFLVGNTLPNVLLFPRNKLKPLDNFCIYDTILKYGLHATWVAFIPVLKEGSSAKNPENW